MFAHICDRWAPVSGFTRAAGPPRLQDLHSGPAGQTRAGQIYSVMLGSRTRRLHVSRLSAKPCRLQTHRRLQALGMVAKTAKPTIMVAWENTQPIRAASHGPSLAGRSPPGERPDPPAARAARSGRRP